MKTSFVWGALFAASLASPAIAQSVAGPVRTVTSDAAAAHAVAPAASEKADSLKEIYSTFNHDRDNLYVAGSGYSITSADSGQGWGQQYIAMPFTPSESGTVRKIVVAVSSLSGANSVLVFLRADEAGLPGARLGRFRVVDLPNFGTCCETETVYAKGIPVSAGTPYWVEVKAIADTDAAWNINSIRAEGTIAVQQGQGWFGTETDLAAFKVLGD